MRYRSITVRDLSEIRRIYKQQEDSFVLPISASEVAGVAVDANNKIVGFAMVRRIAETILVLDLERSRKARIEALKAIFEGAFLESRLAGYDQVHAFVQDPRFSKLLQKHFGFRPCKGEALVVDTGVDNGEE